MSVQMNVAAYESEDVNATAKVIYPELDAQF